VSGARVLPQCAVHMVFVNVWNVGGLMTKVAQTKHLGTCFLSVGETQVAAIVGVTFVASLPGKILTILMSVVRMAMIALDAKAELA
jgi:hypothetical protein